MFKLTCTFEEFKKIAREFHENASTLNQAELDNAWKCLALSYIGMLDTGEEDSALVVLELETRIFVLREIELKNQRGPSR